MAPVLRIAVFSLLIGVFFGGIGALTGRPFFRSAVAAIASFLALALTAVSVLPRHINLGLILVLLLGCLLSTMLLVKRKKVVRASDATATGAQGASRSALPRSKAKQVLRMVPTDKIDSTDHG